MQTKIESTGFAQIGKIASVIFDDANYDKKVELKLGDYEIVVRDGKTYAVFKKPKYPTTYAECCDVLKIPNDERYIDIDVPLDYNKLVSSFTELLICCKAYWKIAGEQMGLDEPWKPDWSTSKPKYVLACTCNGTEKQWETTYCKTFAFPTEEMRDAFYENFKDLIEQCKELL